MLTRCWSRTVKPASRDRRMGQDMSVHTNLETTRLLGRNAGFMASYLEALTLVERLHRLLLDVIKDEFERVGVIEVNAVQALLLFNIGEHEVTAGELKTRGYYQGSNVSYNLRKLVDMGYMHHQRCEIDRRSVRVRLTEKGRKIRDIVARLFATHAEGLISRGVLDMNGMDEITHALRRIERYWSDQIRYIY
jgi:DNA-binding MarR family transcriptional regulator